MVVDVQQVEKVPVSSCPLERLTVAPHYGPLACGGVQRDQRADPPNGCRFIQTDTNACLFLNNLSLLVRGDEELEEDINGHRLRPSAGLFNWTTVFRL